MRNRREELPSLELGRGLFFANISIEELASAQNVQPIKSAADLATTLSESEEVDTMLEEIYSSRK